MKVSTPSFIAQSNRLYEAYISNKSIKIVEVVNNEGAITTRMPLLFSKKVSKESRGNRTIKKINK